MNRVNYLALGDSMSIDRYTGVDGGGAVNQFARLIGAQVIQDLTHDGFTTDQVMNSLAKVNIEPDIITMTVGGNDLLQRQSWNIDRYSLQDPDTAKTLSNMERIYERLEEYGCPVIVNTIYDPTDGDATLMTQLGMSGPFQVAFEETNSGIKALAALYEFMLSDLCELFKGHGIKSHDTWVTMEIEPNLAGATAIASHWNYLASRVLFHPLP